MNTNLTSNATNTTSSPPRGSPPGQTLEIKISLCVISVLTLVGNGMVIYFIASRRRLRTKTNLMVASLAVSDLFVGMAIIPSFLACMYVECDSQLSKLFYDAFLFISVCNLCCITFDRFLAVTRPLRYHMKVTKKRVVAMIVVSWIIPSIVSLIPVTWLYTDTSIEKVSLNNKIFYTIQVVVFMFFPCMIMLIAYGVIFRIALKQTRQMRHVVSHLSLNSTASSQIPSTTTREAKASLRVFGTVVTVFVLFWSLSAFRSIVFYYQLMTLPFDLIMTSRMLLVSNSAINPIIYALWKKDIKMEIRKMLKVNTRMVRPSSGTFRSSQDLRYDTTSNADASSLKRTPSHAGSTQDISLPQVKKLNKPLNGIVNEAIDETPTAKTKDITEERAIDENPTTETKDMGEEKAIDEKPSTKAKDTKEDKPQEQTDSTINQGIDNLGTDVDGMV